MDTLKLVRDPISTTIPGRNFHIMNRIAIGQICSSSRLSDNLRIVTKLISQAMDNDVKLIFFPEATDFLSQSVAHSKVLAQQTHDFVNNLQSEIKSLSALKKREIDVSIGVHLPPSENDVKNNDTRVKNVLLYINHDGKIVGSYQKLHLFDVDVPNGPILRESESVQPGNKLPQIINTPAGKLGTAICYDIRFPELALRLRSLGSEIICYPSAFTMKTGEAHWELLARARAIDTQCYIVMPGQCGIHDVQNDNWSQNQFESGNGVKRESWGHSMIVDPWGTVIAKADPAIKGEQLIIANIDKNKLKEIRETMPLWEQRRKGIF